MAFSISDGTEASTHDTLVSADLSKRANWYMVAWVIRGQKVEACGFESAV